MSILIIIVCLGVMKVSGLNPPVKLSDYFIHHFMIITGKLILVSSIVAVFIMMTQPKNSASYIIVGFSILIIFHFLEGFSIQRTFLNTLKKND